MNGLQLGPADPSDPLIAALIRTHHETGRLHYDEADCHSLDTVAVAETGTRMRAVWLDQVPIAIGGLKDLGAGEVELKSMHTSQAARGRGVASALLTHLMDVARAAGHRTMRLEAGRADAYAAPARALYRRHGFVECPPFGDYVAREASIFMMRAL